MSDEDSESNDEIDQDDEAECWLNYARSGRWATDAELAVVEVPSHDGSVDDE